MPAVFRNCLISVTFWLVASVAQAQVVGELVSAEQGAQPGSRSTVALKLTHDPGWHTYWAAPGIGEATSIDWTLPDGWVASNIDWPVPVKIYTKAGVVSGHGFEGTAYLPIDVIVSPDAPVGETVTLGANVKWLMCEYEICIPGGAELELALPIVDKTPAPNTVVQAALAATSMPEAGESFAIAATRTGELMTLTVEGEASFSNPHFFSFDELVWHDAVQEYELSDGKLEATLPIDSYYEPEITTLSGVLAFTDGEGRYRGLLINAPLTTANSTGSGAAPAMSVTSGLGGATALGVGQALLFAFIGGLILNLMPCVLPILSMKALGLANAAGFEAAVVRQEGWLYAAGVVVSMVALAALLLVARAALGAVGWGFHLQNPVVVLALALTMVAVGLNLLGVFEAGLGLTSVGDSLTKGHSAVASFMTGVLAVVVAAPCTAPFMAAALGAALVQPVPIALSIFAMLGLGLAFPYLLIAVSPATRRWLPKPGAWMVVFRQLLAFPMFATAIWLLWVVGGQRGSDAMALGLIAVLLLGLGAWAYGGLQKSQRRSPWVLTIAAALLLLSWMFVQMNKLSSAALVTSSRATANAEALFEEVAYTPDALSAALQEEKPVFAYFTADWCVTCKVNERAAIKTATAAEAFKENGVTVMVGDWTNQNPDITEILVRYGRAGVPMYLYFPPGSTTADGQLLPQILTPRLLAETVQPPGSTVSQH